ncbi:NAD-glutamate dehydrogenase domain-containing protein [Oceanidesulfovibrio indonesiensis]|nr:NAD-glutamate dehydrogenase domain-containing protein [Oceanidesulfovibrio indonesiensis]
MPDDAPDLSPDHFLERVTESLGRETAAVVPWFLENMPSYYFRSHSEDEITRHLMALASGRMTSETAIDLAHCEPGDFPCRARKGQVLALHDSRRNLVTYISPSTPSSLEAVMERHDDFNLHTARLYESLDKAIRLDTLLLDPQQPTDPDSDEFAAAVQAMRERVGGDPEACGIPAAYAADWEERFRRMLAGASRDYVAKFDSERSLRHLNAALSLADADPEGAEIRCEMLPKDGESRILLVMADPPPTALLSMVVRVLLRHGAAIHRGYLDRFASAGPEFREETGRRGLAVMSFYVCRDGTPFPDTGPAWEALSGELASLKWHAPHGLEILADEDGWDLRQVMLLMAGCELAHQFLIAENLWAYTADNIVEAVLRCRSTAGLVVRYFEARFDPGRADEPQETQTQAAIAAREAVAELDDEVARRTFETMLEFFANTLRTNYFLPGHHCLAFRFEPEFLKTVGAMNDGDELPYGVYFVHGPDSLGFHVRHRATARGGLRVVPTRKQEQFELESNRLFTEAASLARAQQFKNKDIPEGGAKAVVLLGPRADLDLCVRGFVDGLLDLIVYDPTSDRRALPGVRDYMDPEREEILYLGPDEQIAEHHIVWAVSRARQRGYPWPQAFMSSKPGAGINHKEYGVTSLGVVVYACEVLKELGINPTNDVFRVKLTGGPAGDVAGNAIRLLARDYPHTARIVAVADGHGAAFDPEGLNMDELLRLVEQETSISTFDSSKLSSNDAFVTDTETPEGVRARNTLFAVAEAELFIPAGGRPDTLNAKNWRAFLNDAGEPTARAIVEGANLFLSAEARSSLEDCGVLVVPGPSANKTGVICSSYEILGGLVMDEEEFIAHKQRYVAEVLNILEVRARDEARLLLRERRACGACAPLSELSNMLSREINDASDALERAFVQEAPAIGSLDEDSAWARLLRAYCPPLLVERFAERILDRVPRRHLLALLSAAAASRIVYAEGLGWLSRHADMDSMDHLARVYLEQEARLTALMDSLAPYDIAEKETLLRILQRSGRKALTDEALGLV